MQNIHKMFTEQLALANKYSTHDVTLYAEMYPPTSRRSFRIAVRTLQYHVEFYVYRARQAIMVDISAQHKDLPPENRMRIVVLLCARWMPELLSSELLASRISDIIEHGLKWNPNTEFAKHLIINTSNRGVSCSYGEQLQQDTQYIVRTFSDVEWNRMQVYNYTPFADGVVLHLTPPEPLNDAALAHRQLVEVAFSFTQERVRIKYGRTTHITISRRLFDDKRILSEIRDILTLIPPEPERERVREPVAEQKKQSSRSFASLKEG